jgi:hypothetical protein
MVSHASQVTGKEITKAMISSGMLGEKVNKTSKASLSHYTTTYRQEIVFHAMKKIVLGYLRLWYV